MKFSKYIRVTISVIFVQFMFITVPWFCQVAAQKLYLRFKSLSISSFETCFCWARNPTWLNKLECCKSILCSLLRMMWPSYVKILIWSSSWVCFLSEERISLISVSRHWRLEESITSSTSFSFSLFVWKESIGGDAFVVSNSLLLDPSNFLGWSFIEHGKDSFSFGE